MSLEERQAFEEYVSFTEKCMNFEVDPRDDFMKYAGGKFREEDFNSKASEWPPGSLDVTEIVYSLLEDDRISNPALQKARDFHRSKEDLLRNGMKEFLKTDQFIGFCGGVPAFNDHWRAENFNLARAAGILSALWLNTILKPEIEYLDDAKVISVDYVFLGGYFLEYLNEVLDILELDDEKLADIINNLNVIMESYPKNLLDGEPITITGAEIDDIEIFDLREFIEIALCININDNDTIRLQEGVMQSLSILNRFDRITLAHYITVQATLLYHNQPKLFAQFEFLRYFKPIFISTGFDSYYSEAEGEKVKQMVKRFSESFEMVKNDFPEEASTHVLFGMDIDQILQDVKDHYSPSKIHAEYQDLDISSDDFYQNLISLRNYEAPESLKHYLSCRGHDKAIASSELSLLSYIVEHYKKPMVYHFGRLPFTFWRIIMMERLFHSQFSEKENFTIPEEILKSQIKHREDWLSHFSANEIIITIESLHYAYSDYKKWMEENEVIVGWQNEILSRINLDCRKLFFVVFAQCNPYDPDKCTSTSALMNFMDFSKVFECNPESPMNPRKFMLIN